MGGRRVHARVRRPAAAGRRARRPLRAPPHAAGRARGVRRRVCGRGVRRRRGGADRRPRGDGRGGGVHHARDAFAARSACSRTRASARPRSACGPRRPASASRWARWSAGSCSTTSAWGSIFIVNIPLCAAALVVGPRVIAESLDPSAPRVDWLGAALSGVALLALVWAVIEAPSEGWTALRGARGVRCRRRAVGRVRGAAAAGRRAAARPRVVPEPALHRGEQHDHGALLRALRLPVPVHAVPPVRARLLAVRGRRAGAALRRRR